MLGHRSIQDEGIKEPVVVVQLRIWFQSLLCQMFIQCQDVCIGDILEIADLAPCREEPHETAVTLLTVISLAILTDLCPLLAEL